MVNAITAAVATCRAALDEERERLKRAFVGYLEGLPGRLRGMAEASRGSGLFPYDEQGARAAFERDEKALTGEAINRTIGRVIERLRVELHASLRDLSAVREYITLCIPMHESGNLVGVNVMEFVIKSLDVSCEKLSTYATDIPEYFSKRAESLDRFGVEHSSEVETTNSKEVSNSSDPKKAKEEKVTTKEENKTTKRHLRPNKDYENYIVAYDTEWYLQLRRVWGELGSIHACMADQITKNINYIVDPKNERSSGHGGHMVY